MSAIGGPLRSVAINGREFKVTASSDAGRTLGGFTNEYQANGDGTMRLIKTPIPWKMGSMEVECDDANSDHEFLRDVQKAASEADVLVTYPSGKQYTGTGQITGDLESSSSSVSASFELSGPGELKAL